MSEWKIFSLVDLADILNNRRVPLSSMQRINRKGEFPYYGASGIIDYVDDYIFEGEHVLISEDGENLRTRNTPIAFLANGKFWVNNHAHIVKGKKSFHNKLIVYSFKNLDLHPYITGAVQPKLNKANLVTIPFYLPCDESEQQTIAEVLSSLDDKIDLLHRQNQTLEQMAETLFRKWFIEDANEKNWKESTFGELVTPKKGKNITKTEAVEGEYPVVAGGLEPSCYHNEANTLEPVITISASGANAGFVRLYHTRVWSSDSSYIDKSITPNLFFCYIFLKIKQSNLFDKQEGSAQPHIYPKHIMDLESFEYPIELIEMFEKEVTPMFQKIKYNLKQITSLEQLRDTLLPKLMNGEVRVKTI